MRDIEGPILAAAKAQNMWSPPHLMAAVTGTLPRTELQENLAKVQSLLRSDLVKTFFAVEPLGWRVRQAHVDDGVVYRA